MNEFISMLQVKLVSLLPLHQKLLVGLDRGGGGGHDRGRGGSGGGYDHCGSGGGYDHCGSTSNVFDFTFQLLSRYDNEVDQLLILRTPRITKYKDPTLHQSYFNSTGNENLNTSLL